MPIIYVLILHYSKTIAMVIEPWKVVELGIFLHAAVTHITCCQAWLSVNVRPVNLNDSLAAACDSLVLHSWRANRRVSQVVPGNFRSSVTFSGLQFINSNLTNTDHRCTRSRDVRTQKLFWWDLEEFHWWETYVCVYDTFIPSRGGNSDICMAS